MLFQPKGLFLDMFDQSVEQFFIKFRPFGSFWSISGLNLKVFRDQLCGSIPSCGRGGTLSFYKTNETNLIKRVSHIAHRVSYNVI